MRQCLEVAEQWIRWSLETHDEVCILGLDVLRYPDKKGAERSMQPETLLPHHHTKAYISASAGQGRAGTYFHHDCIPESYRE